jgi:DNA modification methylase
MTARVIHADCLDAMRAMPDASIDAIVTDPPYGLSFMGRDWDHGVPGPAFWTEALRVAKPGAHLVAFGGTRTYHRLACAIEDAGWEIRDCLSWLYGSGFPKSLDVSKAIDKLDATDEQKRRRFKFTEWVRSTGATARQIDEATGTRMGNHYTTHPTQPAIMTREHLDACRYLLGDVPEWVERECKIRSVESANFANRKVLEMREMRDTQQVRIACAASAAEYNPAARAVVSITAPATDAARQWQGWGTALKPAWEPCILARKPLVGTVAANVLAHGTGAINVNACRIAGKLDGDPHRFAKTDGGTFVASFSGHVPVVRTEGRWPANAALDEEAAAMLGEPARFFYTAKASRSERNDGCDAIEARPQDPTRDVDAPGGNNPRNRGAAPRVNSHPTVKPVALMRWLVRMVTPPGGVVLDPFCGSGTTLVAAIEEGFDCIGIEREAEYVAIIDARVAAAQQRPQRVAKPRPKRQPVNVQPAATAPPTPIVSAPLPGQLALAWGAE